MSEYKDEILNHSYDGIQEYDNPMPGWWKNIFYLTIAWSGVYLVGLGFGHVWDYERDLNEGQKELVAMRRAYEAAQPPVVITEEMLSGALGDDEKVALGKQAFGMNCAACHGDQGQGLIGPNLTDDHWLYGAKLTEIHRIVANGTPNGMPPWSKVLSPDEMVGVIAYIDTLHGSNPPNAKAPQGDKVIREGKDEKAKTEEHTTLSPNTGK
ncbi:MAG: cbb3-type cytochrome c oxidase N-terminal domain-containing protein [Myxococcota bacterium]|nr:cbb3-type cytochrome c oxidase N-terminal domain-containing protein [Myxococcota bacterium]